MILLTGASGVVGAEVAPRLPADRLIVARYRSPPPVEAETVTLDIRAPNLGLSPADYDALADRIDTVVHCAAVTDMSSAAEGVDETNIAGARHMADFAVRAGAVLHFVSTAYASAAHTAQDASTSPYVRSKQAAEDAVRECAAPWTVIRPSIVAGRADTGAIARFQGFHLFIAAILKGRAPVIPLARDARCDFTSVDRVAEAIAALVAAPDYGRTYWLTAGDAALTIGDMLEVGQPFAEAMGRSLSATRFIAPDAIDLDALRPRSRERMATLAGLSRVMATPRAFPSDMADMIGAAPDHDSLAETLRANLRYWGAETGAPFCGL